jgi:hypothetical protein
VCDVRVHAETTPTFLLTLMKDPPQSRNGSSKPIRAQYYFLKDKQSNEVQRLGKGLQMEDFWR